MVFFNEELHLSFSESSSSSSSESSSSDSDSDSESSSNNNNGSSFETSTETAGSVASARSKDESGVAAAATKHNASCCSSASKKERKKKRKDAAKAEGYGEEKEGEEEGGCRVEHLRRSTMELRGHAEEICREMKWGNTIPGLAGTVQFEFPAVPVAFDDDTISLTNTVRFDGTTTQLSLAGDETVRSSRRLSRRNSSRRLSRHSSRTSNQLDGGISFLEFQEKSPFLDSVSLKELTDLLAEPLGSRDGPRCAELCADLHVFTQLSEEQAAELLQVGNVCQPRPGELIYHAGDPTGHVYIILCGSVTMEQSLDELNGFKAFVQTVFDGRAFGDTFQQGEEGGRRVSAAISQESSLILKLNTEEYLRVVSVERTNSHALLELLPFLAPCSTHHIALLADFLEFSTASHGDSLIRLGERPTELVIVAKGSCQLLARNATDKWVMVRELGVGSCFGHGALLHDDNPCPYVAKNAVVVDSWEAEFYSLSRDVLSDVLPGFILDKVVRRLERCYKSDPLLESSEQVVNQDHNWQLEKMRILKKELRCPVGPEQLLKAEQQQQKVAWKRIGPCGLPGLLPKVKSETKLSPSRQRLDAMVGLSEGKFEAMRSMTSSPSAKIAHTPAGQERRSVRKSINSIMSDWNRKTLHDSASRR